MPTARLFRLLWIWGMCALAGCPSFDKEAVPNLPPAASIAVTPEGALGRGGRATLDGSQSADPEGKPLTFRWEQLTGDPVALSSTTAPVVTFDAPDRPQVLTLQLVVSDGLHESPPAYVRVVVEYNLAPQADPGDSREVIDGAAVLLSGRAVDPDGDPITAWQWTVEAEPVAAGATHVLSGENTASAVFTPLAKGFFTLALSVTDGRGAQSLPATVVIRSLNAPPVARAGQAQKGPNLSTMLLMASASDADPGEALTYRWQIDSAPAGASLPDMEGDASTVLAFTPRGKGLYTLAFTASDGEAESAPARVLVSALDNAPGVRASAMTTPNLTALTLAAESSDLDGDPVALEWTMASSGGKPYTLAPSAGGLTVFTPHKQGDYTLRVTPFDGEQRGPAAEVTVTSLNRAPAAVLLSASSVEATTGGQVRLTGDAADPDGDAVTSFRWSVVSAPDLPAVAPDYTLSGAGGPNALLRPWVKGFYALSLVVEDPAGAVSLPALVAVQVNNAPPVADAGPARTGQNRSTILVQGTASDPDVEDTLGYRWAVESAPAGAALPTLDGETTLSLAVTPRGKGLYTLALTASDGQATSAPSRVLVSALNNLPTVSASWFSTANLEPVRLQAQTQDLDGDPVSVSWSVLSGPDHDLAAEGGVTTFTPRGQGAYQLLATPHDGADAGSAVEITVTATNTRPSATIAIVVGGSSVFTGTEMVLSAVGGDPDGDDITAWSWSVTAPPDDPLVDPDYDLDGASSAAALFTPRAKGPYLFSLVVTDQLGLASLPARLVVQVVNAPPVASAGSTQKGPNRAPILLRGTAVDPDPGDTLLTYQWVLEQAPPAAGLPDLVGEESTDLWVTPRGKGLYTFAFTASDGPATSAPSRVILAALNNPPTARSGNMTTPNLTALTLGAFGSDVDGDPVQLRWSMVDAGGKPFMLSPAAGGLTVFTPQGKGTYRLRVTPFDGEEDGASVEVTVAATNNPPLAVVSSSAEAVSTTEEFTLSAEDSYDPDGETALSYAWVKKSGSAAIVGPTNRATLTVRAGGVKEALNFEVAVTDGSTATGKAQARVVVDNSGPVAVATGPSAGDAQSAVQLDGSQSFDLETAASSLLYQWSSPSDPGLVFVPSAMVQKPSITLPTRVGSVVVALEVFDGRLWSAPATKSVAIIPDESVAIFVDQGATCAPNCDGARAAPYATITDGASVAALETATTPRTVLVAAGTYGPSTIPKRVSVTGGCDTAQWICDGAAGKTILQPADASTALSLPGGLPSADIGTVRGLTVKSSKTVPGDLVAVDCNGCAVVLEDLVVDGGGQGGTSRTNPRTWAVRVRGNPGPVTLRRVQITAGAGAENYGLEAVGTFNLTVEDSSFTSQEFPQPHESPGRYNMSNVLVRLTGTAPGNKALLTRNRYELNGLGTLTSDCFGFLIEGPLEATVSSSFFWHRAVPAAYIALGASVVFSDTVPSYFINDTFLGNDVARALPQNQAGQSMVFMMGNYAATNFVYDSYFENYGYAVYGGSNKVVFTNDRWHRIADYTVDYAYQAVSYLNVPSDGSPGYLQGSSLNSEQDCLLVDVGDNDEAVDLHLQGTSPCLEASVTSDVRSPTFDVDGDPFGAARDIGADEVLP